MTMPQVSSRREDDCVHESKAQVVAVRRGATFDAPLVDRVGPKHAFEHTCGRPISRSSPRPSAGFAPFSAPRYARGCFQCSHLAETVLDRCWNRGNQRTTRCSVCPIRYAWRYCMEHEFCWPRAKRISIELMARLPTMGGVEEGGLPHTAAADAIRYVPTRPELIRHICRTLPIRHQRYTFVYFGIGTRKSTLARFPLPCSSRSSASRFPHNTIKLRRTTSPPMTPQAGSVMRLKQSAWMRQSMSSRNQIWLST